MRETPKIELKIFIEADDVSLPLFYNSFGSDLNYFETEVFRTPDDFEAFEKFDIFFTPTVIMKNTSGKFIRYYGFSNTLISILSAGLSKIKSHEIVSEANLLLLQSDHLIKKGKNQIDDCKSDHS